MKILLLHCEYIRFRALKKALKNAEELGKEKQEQSVKEPLVVFIAVEKGDSAESAVGLVKAIRDVAGKVHADKIVLYPYAHLSSTLAAPEIALRVLKDAEQLLKKEKFGVVRAPFGYYKSFELKCKGHPLAELSREIRGENINEAQEKYDYRQLLREISKSKLDSRKLKENDHRILGQQMDLFSFNDVSPGMVFWHNNGLIIYNELISFLRDKLREEGYQEIKTPEILDKKLWMISGHWEKYRENIFLTEYEKRSFAAKPMNCPGGMLVYKVSPKSYKDLPLKLAEFGIVHRQELSGVLSGLFRVIEFTQDDAHVFCTGEQLEEEILKLLKFIDNIYKKFGFKYQVELSTRPEKRIGSEEIWDKSEKALENVLKKNKIKYKLNKGDGAFYGPKIDFHIEDSLKRTWQLATIQLDFSMPERFDLRYVDKDNQRKQPIMIHRAVLGSIERFIGILLEHTRGRLPVWMAPIQVRILSFTSKNKKYAQKLLRKIKKEIPDARIDSDFRDLPIPGKVKDAELMRIPYIIVVGNKEEKNNSIAVRIKGDKKIKNTKVDSFIKQLKHEIKEKK